jgi:hypothetical protein
MKFTKFNALLFFSVALGAENVRAQDHGHLNVGATSTSQNAQLNWNNGADFGATAGYVKTLDYTNSGKYAGYYQNNITLTVLPATADYGGPAVGAPALGSFILGRMSLLAGPEGGLFNFWETNSTALTGPYISVAVGWPATNLFQLSQTDGSAGTDPFGHIHGRRFSATKPGLYKVGFQAIDVSTNGTGGGPIHTPSDVIPIYFQAGPTLPWISKSNNLTRVTFGSISNRTCIIEVSTNLSLTNWTAIATNSGTDYFQTITDTNSIGTQRFYRMRVDNP